MTRTHALTRVASLVCCYLAAAACGAQQPGVVHVNSPVGGEVIEVRNGTVSTFTGPATGAVELWYWVRSPDDQPRTVAPDIVSLAAGKATDVPSMPQATVWDAWKQVGFTFTVPEGADRVEIRWQVLPDSSAYVAGLKLIPATDAGGYEKIKPPAHPYLYFRREDVPKLLQKAQQPIARDIWARVKQQADRLVDSPFPELITGDPERSSRQASQHASNARLLSFVYALTGDTRYADRARREIADALVGERWTHPKHTGDADLVSAEISFGLAVSYDWLYDALPNDERVRLRDTVIRRGLEPIFRASAEGVWWSNWYRCNWTNVIHGQAGAAALAFLGEDPRVPVWVNTCKEKILLSRAEMGRDGGWGEGASYTTYAWGCAAYFMAALRNITGGRDDLFDDPHLRLAHLFHIYLLTPDFGGFVPFSNYAGGVTIGGEYYRALAAESRDPHAQWAADLMRSWSPSTNLFGFLWCDPTLEARPPSDLPLARYFRDIQWATLRTSWTDPNAVLFAFKGGYNDWDHHHHDLNHFVLYAYGRPLITDLGYPHERWGCLTEAHNTIMVNGKEQLDGVNVAGGRGGADHWGEITDFMHTPGYDYIQGDASRAYDPADVKRFTREVMFLRPDCFVLFDDVLATKPSRFDWHLHTFGEMSVAGDTILIRQDGAGVAVKMLTPAAFTHQVLHKSWEEAGIEKPFPTALADTFVKLSPAEPADSARFLAVLFPQPVAEGAEPACPSVQAISQPGLLGAAVQRGDARDVALFALGAEPIQFEQIRTDARRCFVRFEGGQPTRFAVHNATFLQVGDRRVFESPEASSEARVLPGASALYPPAS